MTLCKASQQTRVGVAPPQDPTDPIGGIQPRDVVEPGIARRRQWARHAGSGLPKRWAVGNPIRQPAKEHVEEFLRVDGFRDVVVHAGGERSFTVAGHRVRGHREDRQTVTPWRRADPPRGFQSIHDRHLQVHQHEVVRALRGALHAQRAVLGELDVNARRAEQFEGHLLIELVVFDEQDARTLQSSKISCLGVRRGHRLAGARPTGDLGAQGAHGGVEEQRRADRFDEDAVETRSLGLAQYVLAAVRGHQHAARTGAKRHRINPPCGLHAIEAWHPPVEEYDGERISIAVRPGDGRERLFSRRDRLDAERHAPQHLRERMHRERVVIDDQHPPSTKIELRQVGAAFRLTPAKPRREEERAAATRLARRRRPHLPSAPPTVC